MLNENGTETFIYPDGTVITIRPDGTPETTVRPDGTVVSFRLDGTTETVTCPSGTVITYHPDGTRESATAMAGTVTTYRPDGTRESAIASEGTVTVYRQDGTEDIDPGMVGRDHRTIPAEYVSDDSTRAVPWGWRAACSCGWLGELRRPASRNSARDETRAHVVTERDLGDHQAAECRRDIAAAKAAAAILRPRLGANWDYMIISGATTNVGTPALRVVLDPTDDLPDGHGNSEGAAPGAESEAARMLVRLVRRGCLPDVDGIRAVCGGVAVLRTELIGPQGRFVGGILDRAREFTYADGAALAAVCAPDRIASVPARVAARRAAWAGGRGVALEAAWDAAYNPAYRAADAAWSALWADAWAATWAAAWAVACRDLIGEGFTQEQYDILTSPWRRAIGPAHPGDRGRGLS
jgi:hypothetical protein